MELRPFAANIWTLTASQRFLGVHIDNAMTVVRLPDGKLWLHSPVNVPPECQRQLESLGEPAYAVAPNLKHYLHLQAFSERYPHVKIYGAPRLGRKLAKLFPAVTLHDELGNQQNTPWQDCIDQALIEGAPAFQEMVFLHKPSKTLITTDLMFNYSSLQSSILRRGIHWLGKDRPMGLFADSLLPMPRDVDRLAASLNRVLAWDFDNLIMCHGEPVRGNARGVLREAYRRYLG